MTSSNVAIIGLGLIGGSLGLALKQAWGDGITITGWDRDAEAGTLAEGVGAIDRAMDDPAGAAAEADLVVVAVPVLAIHEIFQAIAPAVHRSTVVTDVASTKALVCEWAEEFFAESFVGGHPMAGSERSGVGNAHAALFAGATYCLTPTPATAPEAIARVTAMVQAIGARPYQLSPAEHDRAVAAISHLPFLLSTALVDVTTNSPEWDAMRALAASGYRDVSRLASGDARMHRDICVTNADEIRPWLTAAARALQQLADELHDGAAMLRRFEEAKVARDQWIGGKGSSG